MLGFLLSIDVVYLSSSALVFYFGGDMKKKYKFKIHFTIAEIDDFFVIEATTLNQVQIQAKRECFRRGLTHEKNNLWSEEIYGS